MSDLLKESLSAVMDGEADDFEMRRALDEASNDPTLRGVWERYHLVRSVMRGEGRAPANSLGNRFWNRIDAGEGADDDVEPALVGPTARRTRWSSGWAQRLAGVAVAVGVAAAVVVGFRTHETAPVETPNVAVVEPSAPPASMALFDDEVRGQAAPAALDVRRSQRAYMLHHARHVALNNRSVVPFVKVAAFESR